VIASHQGNWMASNLSHLGGYFAGILQLEVPEEHLFGLTTELERMSDLDIKIQQGLDSEIHPDKQLQFVITGNDRPGIVRELSSVIKHKGANITHFESSKQSAPNWGVPLFHAIATVQLPAGLNKDEVVKALEAIASDVVVDVEH
jgi:glycine cleavage system regulatory protein